MLLDIEDEHRVPSDGVTQLYPVIVGHTNTLSLSLDMLGSAYILVPSKPTKKRYVVMTKTKCFHRKIVPISSET